MSLRQCHQSVAARFVMRTEPVSARLWPIENEAGQRVGAVSGPDSTHSGPAEPAATGFSRFCGSPKYGAGFESLRRDTVP